MRVNLLQLLQQRPIVHPCQVEELTLRNEELRLRLIGVPWWAPDLDRTRDHRLELIFGGVGEGRLDPRDFSPEDDHELETVHVTELDKAPWAQREGVAIFCGAPLPRPHDLYAVVEGLLVAQRSVRRPDHYLNCGGDSRAYRRIAQSSGYLLGNFPPVLRDAVVAELGAQGVPYTEHPTGFHPMGALLVRFQQSWFFCESAEAEFDA